MTELVTVTIKNHIADVRLNRPEKMNAITIELMHALVAAAESIKSNRSVRVAVISGEGRAFCAGLDLSNFADDKDAPNPFINSNGSYPNEAQASAYCWKQLPVPVICALHGVAFGGGLQIALGADIRIAHPETRLSVMEVKWGLVPDMSATQTLRDLVRIDVAKELTFTGRVFYADEGASLGLVTRLSDTPFEDAYKIAEEIASKNPDAVCAAKRLYNDSWHGDDRKGLQMEEKLQGELMMSENQIESVRAGMEKRAANFKDRR
ncbi:2,3-dehydroadipyl-CoA hydratase [Zhongshania aliphaticivorans]|uniref:2,3-dehydroadipyl-CoA hydratase n=1 Tax=Zhongshania aliphaticivorans TaxID=1470434 RepID=A0A5S9NRM5_9GAMM|nr:crotonase/enoyl-CoA hydratase family protein [Zhongshania aliphaticivorans]CAA0093160.1 2,3-dehydroadipyl-CoA hydratase [Zhongshania aliphaticivorans]CAA0110954.1 2,3-dehydroadipyl-CoA hydratase [Zhongshania aliphaticivorans]